MAFKLNKAETKQLADLKEKIESCRTAIYDEQATFNATVAEALVPLHVAVEKFNEALGELATFRDEKVEGWSSDIEDKSEAWQEGENGEAAQRLVDAWESFEIEPFTLADDYFKYSDGDLDLDVDIDEMDDDQLPTSADEA